MTQQEVWDNMADKVLVTPEYLTPKIYLTKLQDKVFRLYRNGKTQEQIAILIYGSKHRQGSVSAVLDGVKRKLGAAAVEQYNKKGQGLVEFTLDDLKEVYDDLKREEKGELW